MSFRHFWEGEEERGGRVYSRKWNESEDDQNLRDKTESWTGLIVQLGNGRSTHIYRQQAA